MTRRALVVGVAGFGHALPAVALGGAPAWPVVRRFDTATFNQAAHATLPGSGIVLAANGGTTP